MDKTLAYKDVTIEYNETLVEAAKKILKKDTITEQDIVHLFRGALENAINKGYKIVE